MLRKARWAVQPGLLVAACVSGAGAQQVQASGKFFTVTCEGGDARMAKQALAAVEPVWPLVCQTFGVEAKPKKKLSVVLYRTVDGYMKADKRLTGGRFGPNQAMSHWQSMSAHVAVQPPTSDGCLREHGLPMQTLAMLAWEACHVARFELCANFRIHPKWFGDGLAATTAQRVMHGLYPDMGAQPFFTERWARARRLVEAGDMPTVSVLLADQTQDLAMRDRYAARVVFFTFASSRHPESLRKVAHAVRTTTAGSQYRGKVRKVADRLLGALGDEFVRAVQQADIAWDERRRSLWLVGADWRQQAFSRNAMAFSGTPLRGGQIHAKGKVFVAAGKARQLNFLFADRDEGFYSLALTAGVGWTLFDYRRQNNEWRVVSRSREPGLKVGVDVPFVVKGSGRDLTIEVAGRSKKVRLPQKLPEQLRWGVGAQAGAKGMPGSFGIWRDVTVTGG